jgi:hypothetical protein
MRRRGAALPTAGDVEAARKLAAATRNHLGSDCTAHARMPWRRGPPTRDVPTAGRTLGRVAALAAPTIDPEGLTARALLRPHSITQTELTRWLVDKQWPRWTTTAGSARHAGASSWAGGCSRSAT